MVIIMLIGMIPVILMIKIMSIVLVTMFACLDTTWGWSIFLRVHSRNFSFEKSGSSFESRPAFLLEPAFTGIKPVLSAYAREETKRTGSNFHMAL